MWAEIVGRKLVEMMRALEDSFQILTLRTRLLLRRMELIETLVRKWALMRMLIGPRFGECIRGRMEKGKRMMRWQRIHQNSTI